MKFVREISNEHFIFLFISFQLNMDLDVIEFVPYCDVFLSGTLSSVFFGSSSVIDMVIIFFQKEIFKGLGQVFF